MNKPTEWKVVSRSRPDRERGGKMVFVYCHEENSVITISTPNGGHEDEADKIAAKIVEAVNSTAKGCQCVCHQLPQHHQLQDALEANQFYAKKLKETEIFLAEKNETANVFMNQVKKLQAELEKEWIKNGELREQKERLKDKTLNLVITPFGEPLK